MEGARSSQATVKLGTGVSTPHGILQDVCFREMSGVEEDILAAPKMKVADKITKVLQNCTLSIGPVVARQEINEIIEKMIVADRLFFLIQLRVQSVGAIYSFETHCPECEAADIVDYDLNQVKITSSPKADDLWRDTALPTGAKVRWQIANAKIEGKIEELSNPRNAPTVALYARIESIDGKPASLAMVQSMHFRDRGALRRAIDEAEGEVDDQVEFKCPKCDHCYSGTMPLQTEHFFYPADPR